jgi:4a-hydroxytetrahydrobiopterin dehydratase
VTRPAPLDPAAIDRWLGAHPRWRHEGGRLLADVEIDYERAVDVLAATAATVSRLDHHPSATVEYRRLGLELSTHSVGAITSLDLELAEAFDAALDGPALS